MATWKKVLVGVGALALVVVLGLGAAMYVVFGGMRALEPNAQVGPATAVVDGGYVAAFVLEAPEGGLVLVDSGIAPGGGAFDPELARRGKVAGDVRAVLLTHGHPDHAGGLARFDAATVYAHAADVPLIEGERAADSPLGGLVGVSDSGEVDETVADGDVLDVGGLRVDVFHVPGHTHGSVAYLVDDTLFLGDAAVSLTDGRIGGTPWPFSWDTAVNDASLAQLVSRLDAAGVAVEHLAMGHTAASDDFDALRRYAGGD